MVDRPAHDRRYRVDPSKLLHLGWSPRWSFQAGLTATVRWSAHHPEWWQPIKSGACRAYYNQNCQDRARLLIPLRRRRRATRESR